LFAEWNHSGKPTMLGAASGAVAGLVAITPGAGFVTPLAAIVIGGVAGILCFYAVVMKSRLRYDDSLDVVGVHGVGGTWGAFATGLFASKAVNADGRDGLFLGDASTLGIQVVSIVATWLFAAVATWVILRILDAAMGLRVSNEDEQMGLDLTQHNEAGYTL
jgi:Amt family ammonium transporter